MPHDALGPVPGAVGVAGHPSGTGDRCPGVGPLLQRRPGFADHAVDELRPTVSEQTGAVLREDVGRLVVLAQAEEATERDGRAAVREVEAGRPEHRAVRLLDRHPTSREPAPHHLDQQGMDAVAHLVGAFPDPVDQQTGGLERGEDLARGGVARQVGGDVRRQDGLGRRAQQQVSLAGAQGGEDLACDEVRDTRRGVGPAAHEVAAARGRCAGARGQHDCRAPALAAGRDGLAHLR